MLRLYKYVLIDVLIWKKGTHLAGFLEGFSERVPGSVPRRRLVADPQPQLTRLKDTKYYIYINSTLT